MTFTKTMPAVTKLVPRKVTSVGTPAIATPGVNETTVATALCTAVGAAEGAEGVLVGADVMSSQRGRSFQVVHAS